MATNEPNQPAENEPAQPQQGAERQTPEGLPQASRQGHTQASLQGPNEASRQGPTQGPRKTNRKSPPELTIGPFRLTSVGVKIVGKPELDAWKGPLDFSLWCQKAGPWWIGDMLNQGEASFGESFYAMCEGAVSGDQLNRYASVARRVPLRNRRPALSWSAHAAVARLDSPGQRGLLALAEKNGWSSEELRVEARLYQEQAKKR